MVTYALFFAKCRKSPVRAFRKKTPISVRRCGGGGAKGGTEKVRSFVIFFYGWLPLSASKSQWNLKYSYALYSASIIVLGVFKVSFVDCLVT